MFHSQPLSTKVKFSNQLSLYLTDNKWLKKCKLKELGRLELWSTFHIGVVKLLARSTTTAGTLFGLHFTVTMFLLVFN
uniref:Uncharacterized protein n=1 Tax=Rhizophora mucronata TaxID=61149 RepID=A0A2P2IV98_RHIMU